MNDKPKLGDYIAISSKKSDNSIWEGTEGFVVGDFQDSKRNEYLILDRSTYSNSLKSIFYSLGLTDLFVVNTSEIESMLYVDQRERPPGIEEKMRIKIEVDYKSNIDYEATKVKLQEKRTVFYILINQFKLMAVLILLSKR